MFKYCYQLICLSSLFISSSLFANCGAGGLFDQNTGACYYPNGIEGPYSRPNGNNSNQAPQDYWGAMAIDVVKGNTSGSAQNLPSKTAAETNAIKACKDRNCRVVVSYKNSCGAVATNGGAVDTAASDPNPTQAERKALAMCNKKSDVPCRLWIKAECAGVGY